MHVCTGAGYCHVRFSFPGWLRRRPPLSALSSLSALSALSARGIPGTPDTKPSGLAGADSARPWPRLPLCLSRVRPS